MQSAISSLRLPAARPTMKSPGARRTLTVRATGVINPDIKKGDPKVVDEVVASEMEKPMTAYCRCWRSKTFPKCDGSHVKHNQEVGDNVGPLLVKK